MGRDSPESPGRISAKKLMMIPRRIPMIAVSIYSILAPNLQGLFYCYDIVFDFLEN